MSENPITIARDLLKDGIIGQFHRVSKKYL